MPSANVDAAFVMAQFGRNQGWARQHRRFLTNVTGSQGDDLIGFGDRGVYVAESLGDGRFKNLGKVLDDFGVSQGWHSRHEILVVDLTGNKLGDIVGFGDSHTLIAENLGNGKFRAPIKVFGDLSYAKGWRSERHIRSTANLLESNGDNLVRCLIGVGDRSTLIAQPNSTDGIGFSAPRIHETLSTLTRSHGWRWEYQDVSTAQHAMRFADLTGNGLDDIIAFGDRGVYVALNHSSDSEVKIYSPFLSLENFGTRANWHEGWNSRQIGRVEANGPMSIFGIGNDATYVAKGRGDGTFYPVEKVLDGFSDSDGFTPGLGTCFVIDLTGDGSDDILAFNQRGTWVSFNDGHGQFAEPTLVSDDFGGEDGWSFSDHSRFVGHLNKDKKAAADIVGCGDRGTYVILGNETKEFAIPEVLNRTFEGSLTDITFEYIIKLPGDKIKKSPFPIPLQTESTMFLDFRTGRFQISGFSIEKILDQFKEFMPANQPPLFERVVTDPLEGQFDPSERHLDGIVSADITNINVPDFPDLDGKLKVVVSTRQTVDLGGEKFRARAVSINEENGYFSMHGIGSVSTRIEDIPCAVRIGAKVKPSPFNS